MKELLEQNNLTRFPRVGELIEGKIIGRGKSAVFLDLGAFGTGIIYGREFQEARDALKDLKDGDAVFAKIIELENEEGYIELSLTSAGKELSWKELIRIKEDNELITVKILGANKGGLLAEVSGVPAFLPVSQLSAANYPKVEGADKAKILKELQKFIGKEMEVKIFDIDSSQDKLILSEKAKEAEKIREILKNYKIGDVVDGEITGIVDFGAFIKFPVEAAAEGQSEPLTLEGLIHISELDWRLIESPNQILSVGQKVKAKIINIVDDKIFLSLKALKEDPWKEIDKKCKKGDVVKGLATKINPFGVFVQLVAEPDIQGLCHISEFGTKQKMEESLQVGKEYNFKILLIELNEHKMSLKLVSENNPE